MTIARLRSRSAFLSNLRFSVLWIRKAKNVMHGCLSKMVIEPQKYAPIALFKAVISVGLMANTKHRKKLKIQITVLTSVADSGTLWPSSEEVEK